MPKKDWIKPEKRIRIGINVTTDELQQIDQRARSARLQRAVFIRYVALELPISKAPKTATINEARFAILNGAMHEVGHKLKQLIDILDALEHPTLDHWRLAESKLQYILDELGKVLGVKA